MRMKIPSLALAQARENNQRKKKWHGVAWRPGLWLVSPGRGDMASSLFCIGLKSVIGERAEISASRRMLRMKRDLAEKYMRALDFGERRRDRGGREHGSVRGYAYRPAIALLSAALGAALNHHIAIFTAMLAPTALAPMPEARRQANVSRRALEM